MLNYIVFFRNHGIKRIFEFLHPNGHKSSFSRQTILTHLITGNLQAQIYLTGLVRGSNVGPDMRANATMDHGPRTSSSPKSATGPKPTLLLPPPKEETRKANGGESRSQRRRESWSSMVTSPHPIPSRRAAPPLHPAFPFGAFSDQIRRPSRLLASPSRNRGRSRSLAPSAP